MIIFFQQNLFSSLLLQIIVYISVIKFISNKVFMMHSLNNALKWCLMESLTLQLMLTKAIYLTNHLKIILISQLSMQNADAKIK